MNPVKFEFAIAADHPSLAGHFPGHPVVPGVLVLDHALLALQRLCGQEIATIQQVKFKSALLPDELAHGTWEVNDARAAFEVVTLREGVTVAIAAGVGLLGSRGRA
jgi:3-hydroxymyristoyl/3-hydroxydecanoyl-(acyl carrier protein) dehydratase